MDEISKWAYTQAVREVVCSRCGMLEGRGCVTPQNRKTLTPHTERTSAYLAKIGREEFDRRHKITPKIFS